MNQFVDAKELSLKFPETFERLSQKEEIENLKSGDFVKVCHKNERFWVEVKLIEKNNIIGRIDNELICSNLKYNDLIKFTKDNVYLVYNDELSYA